MTKIALKENTYSGRTPMEVTSSISALDAQSKPVPSAARVVTSNLSSLHFTAANKMLPLVTRV